MGGICVWLESVCGWNLCVVVRRYIHVDFLIPYDG